jgi:hypothetical protein
LTATVAIQAVGVVYWSGAGFAAHRAATVNSPA